VERSAGPSLQVWFRPLRPLWYLGPGWAAIGGGLAAGAFSFAPAQVLTLLLAWYLADPLLGTIWELGVGASVPGVQRGIWFRLLRDPHPEDAAPLVILPYTRPGSPGWRLARWMGRLRDWWRADFWPEMGHAFVTLAVGLGAALAAGAALGRVVTALAAFSAALSWLVARLQADYPIITSGGFAVSHTAAGLQLRRKGAEDRHLEQGEMSVSSRARPFVSLRVTAGEKAGPYSEAAASTTRPGAATLRALGEFGIPWLIGCLAFGPPAWPAMVLGVCYTIVYAGMLQQPSRFQLVGGGQLAAVWLLVGLRQPIAATATAVILIAQWGLHARSQDNAARAAGLRACQPLILLSLVGAVLAVGL
jgi:hypothetical protein